MGQRLRFVRDFYAGELLLQSLLIVLHGGNLLLQCLLVILLQNVGALETLNLLTLSLCLCFERLGLVFLFCSGDVGVIPLDVLLALKLLQELFMTDKNAIWVNYSNNKTPQGESWMEFDKGGTKVSNTGSCVLILGFLSLR